MSKKTNRLKLVEQDPWLEPVEEALNDRYRKFEGRLKEIETHFGSIEDCALGHKELGIIYDKEAGKIIYREWAPAAYELYIFGDFNNWERQAHPLTKKDFGMWEIALDSATYPPEKLHKTEFKVLVHGQNGWNERIPPFITRVIQKETKDFNAQFWFPEAFDWQGDKFDLGSIQTPLIYEAHVGMASEEENIGSYREFADHILPRIKDLGYNVLQLMAVAEHPYYGSFGYHVSSFFAPSSRFGTPEDLKYLIRQAHKMGIGVIMDVVHSHTVKNINEGLNMFDGTVEQYFHPGERGNHPNWDSKIFNYGKLEVIRFLLSNLRYWMEEFHFDGFRFDGVTSMMYWHHGNTEFNTREKYFYEGVEFDAITYLQLANHLVHQLNPSAYTIAEDVSGMPGLCNPVNDGGIGFDYRLGMGLPDYWIKLLKEKRDEDWNIYEMWDVMNNRIPGVKTIAYAESHDQALVGDKTLAFRLMDKEMYWHMQDGDNNPVVARGMSLHKMIRLFTIALGGSAYLNFMGNEFGHPEWIDFPREGNNWSYKYARRQWSLADRDDLKYKYLQEFDKQMIHIVKANRLFYHEFGKQLNMDMDNQVMIFSRNKLIFIFNFNPEHSIPDYDFIVEEGGDYEVLQNTDNPRYGGFNRIDDQMDYPTTKGKYGEFHLRIYVPNRTAIVLRKKQ